MSLSFAKASNGEEICFWGSKALHSTYNPSLEAMRYVSSLSFNFIPSFLIFLGPCLPFCVNYLRQLFPHTKIIALQFFSGLPLREPKWDHELVLSTPISTGEALFTIIGEEKSFTSEIISWNSTERLFFNEYKNASEAVKYFLSKSRDVLATRFFFSKRWFSNTISFFLHIQNICLPEFCNCPILITASGPSLQELVPEIKKYRSLFYIIALSSSLSVLSYNDITPDICLSTDGGFWAKKHLLILLQEFKNIPLAISPESAIPMDLFSNRVIIPLNYGDGILSKLYSTLQLPNMSSVRNGTVSGTALYLAKSISSGPIFYAGLDMSPMKGFQHSQPNMLENREQYLETKLLNRETRSSVQEICSKGSLELYRQWFSHLPTSLSDVYRLKPLTHSFSNSLGAIIDISFNEAISIIGLTNSEEKSFKYYYSISCKKKLLDFFSMLHQKLLTSDFSHYDLLKDEYIVEFCKTSALQKFLVFEKYKSGQSFIDLKNEVCKILVNVLTSLETIHDN